MGSVIAVSDASGAALSINAYDEYGAPGSSNAGRFQYTGQMWLPVRVTQTNFREEVPQNDWLPR
ncbi:MAG: hypothetical protein JNM59_06390 [Hyphomonadaceae bacterium]|nr:hypothetical protein [Hyphomonadaceae bacterium]